MHWQLPVLPLEKLKKNKKKSYAIIKKPLPSIPQQATIVMTKPIKSVKPNPTRQKFQPTFQPSLPNGMLEQLCQVIAERAKQLQTITNPNNDLTQNSQIQNSQMQNSQIQNSQIQNSWTMQLLLGGVNKINEKILEESQELITAAENLMQNLMQNSMQNPTATPTQITESNRLAIIKESSDLLYHMAVLWQALQISPTAIATELANRQQQSGIREKQNRKK